MSADPSSPENDPNLSGLGRDSMDTGGSGSKPSGPWAPPTAEELHAILPQYEIVKMLGRGGMGAVYMGRQISLDRPVAIKILSAALEDADVGFSERFKNEAKAMAKLNHPGIVSVYDFGETEGGLLYIVMEYVDGTDVAQMIAANGRLHTEHAMAITAHVCDALAYAHERGIIHRDIKPANIMVGYDGSVKVADFGLAKVSAGGQTVGLTQSGMAMGTLHFMAPEALILGASVDHRADIYAVGVMLYQMLTGKLPHGIFELPSIQVSGLDPRYDGIIATAMREDRELRYQTASELRRDLDAVLTQPVVKADPAASQAQQPVLPTQARPQRPGGKPVMRQSTGPSVDREPPARGSLTWLCVTVVVVVVLGGVALLILPKGNLDQPGFEAASGTAEPPSASQPALVSATTINPAEATKDRPFVNSLGMKFLPVRETNVLFCIHETRYKDYAAYAADSQGVDVSWRNQSDDGYVITERNEDHPVWNVSWEDAQAFCAWLSRKEGKVYRLPTTEEWTTAVGLGSKENRTEATTLEMLSSKDSTEFPWGGDFPPKSNDMAGNYSDESRKAKAPRGDAQYLDGYDDSFPTTAPVMSFKPNQYGLYDLGGNLWEWCDDWYSNAQKERVLRGGSWNSHGRSFLLSSCRLHFRPAIRTDSYGFRVVLVQEGKASPQLVASLAPPLPAAPVDTESAVRMILSKGGRVTIVVGKEQRVVTREEELPKSGYEVVELRLIAPANKTAILSSADMQTLGGLSALERLILGGITFPDSNLTSLRTLPKLAELELRGSKGLTVESFTHLAGLQSLTHLGTINVPEVDENVLPAILSLPRLESLSLHECKRVTPDFIESLAVLPNLKRLTVSGFQFGRATDLGKLRSLQTLELYDFRGDSTDDALKGLAVGNVINRLRFHGGELTEVQMQEIARWPGLVSLLLENVKLPGSGLALLSGSRTQEMDAGLYDRQLDDATLLSSSRMTALRLIWLGPNSPVTDSGLESFRKERPDVKVERRKPASQLSDEPDLSTRVSPATVVLTTPSAVPVAPLLPASSSTWVDAKGRSIQAKFVRVEGVNVFLDIAGKLTPVPLNTLSAASQKWALDLQAGKSDPAPPFAPVPATAPSPASTPAASFLVHADDFGDASLSSAWRQDGEAWHCLGGDLTTTKAYLQEGGDKGGGIWLMRDLPVNFRVQFKLTQAEKDEAELICEVAGRPATPGSQAVPGYRIHFQAEPKSPQMIRKGTFTLPGKAEPQRGGFSRLFEHVVIERRDGETIEYRNGNQIKARALDSTPIQTGWLGFHFIKGAPLIDELKIYDLDQGKPPSADRLSGDVRSGLLAGQVKDNRNKPAGRVIVRLISVFPVATKTDSLGRFAFKNIATGSYTLRAESSAGEAELILRSGDRWSHVPMTLKPTPTYGIRWVQQTKPGSLSLEGEGTLAGEAWFSTMHHGFVMSRGGPPDRLTEALSCDFSLLMNGRKLTFGNRHGSAPIARLERVPFDAILAVDQGGPLDKQGYFPNPLKYGDNLRQGDVFTVRNETDGTYGKVEIMHVPN